MARVTGLPEGIAWDAVPGATGYNVHIDLTDDPDFLAKVDSGEDTAAIAVTATEYRWPDPAAVDGADFAVVAFSEQANGVVVYSDPYSPEVFRDIPLAFSPVAAPSGGRLLTS